MSKVHLALKEEVRLHLVDILDECKIEKDTDGYWKGDLKQIEHNVFEIAEHLGIKMEELEVKGYDKLSVCCNAKMIEETDICSKCKEHSGTYIEEGAVYV